MSFKIIQPTTNPDTVGRGGVIVPGTRDSVIEFPTTEGTLALTSQISQGGGGTTATQYTVTLADADNTTNEITIATFTIPAGTWADGDVVWMEAWFLQNATGGGVSIQTVSLTGLSDITYNYSGAPASEVITHIMPIYKRFGNDLFYLNSADFATNPLDAGFDYVSGLGLDSELSKETNFDFSVPITFSLKYQWDTAAVDTYMRKLFGKAYREARNGIYY